jgi:hypothetical protein
MTNNQPLPPVVIEVRGTSSSPPADNPTSRSAPSDHPERAGLRAAGYHWHAPGANSVRPDRPALSIHRHPRGNRIPGTRPRQREGRRRRRVRICRQVRQGRALPTRARQPLSGHWLARARQCGPTAPGPAQPGRPLFRQPPEQTTGVREHAVDQTVVVACCRVRLEAVRG